jgi:hypothetical protein
MNRYKPKLPYNKHKEQPELELQKMCVAWFRTHFPDAVMDAGYYSGVKMDAKRGSIAKAAGHVAGMPDIRIYEPRNKYHGLFVELKAPGVAPKARAGAQERVCTKLANSGYCVLFINDFDTFKSEVKNYMLGI